MKVKVRQTCIRTIKNDDPRFNIVDGYVVAPRAGFEISERCPLQYKQILMQAIEHKWIKPIAYVKDTELMWETLGK